MCAAFGPVHNMLGKSVGRSHDNSQLNLANHVSMIKRRCVISGIRWSGDDRALLHTTSGVSDSA